MDNIKEVYDKEACFSPNCYRVFYSDKKFIFGFGEFNTEKNEINVKAEVDLDIDAFKQLFSASVAALIDCNKDTKRNILNEILLEKDGGGEKNE